MPRGQSGKCRVVRQYHVHDCTMTGDRCTDTLPHLTASIPPRLRPLADPTAPVAPHGGNGPIVIMRVRRGQWENAASSGHAVRPCRVREAQGLTGAGEKSDDGSTQPQERKRGGPIAGAPDLCCAFERRAMCGLGVLTGSDICGQG